MALSSATLFSRLAAAMQDSSISSVTFRSRLLIFSSGVSSVFFSRPAEEFAAVRAA